MPWLLVHKTLADKYTLADEPHGQHHTALTLVDKTFAGKYTLADGPPNTTQHTHKLFICNCELNNNKWITILLHWYIK